MSRRSTSGQAIHNQYDLLSNSDLDQGRSGCLITRRNRGARPGEQLVGIGPNPQRKTQRSAATAMSLLDLNASTFFATGRSLPRSFMISSGDILAIDRTACGACRDCVGFSGEVPQRCQSSNAYGNQNHCYKSQSLLAHCYLRIEMTSLRPCFSQ